MAENKLRASLFGYKKDDVHEYIQTMSENAANEIKKYADDVQAAKNEMSSMKEKNNAAMVAKDQELANIKALLAKRQKEVENLQFDIDKLIDEKQSFIQIINDFDKEKTAISEALIVAQQNASNIVVDARTQAEEIMQKLSIEKEEQMRIAAIDMENAKREIGKTATELVTLKEQVVSAMQKYKSELEYIISEYKI